MPARAEGVGARGDRGAVYVLGLIYFAVNFAL
jgi:hypothetical protein